MIRVQKLVRHHSKAVRAMLVVPFAVFIIGILACTFTKYVARVFRAIYEQDGLLVSVFLICIITLALLPLAFWVVRGFQDLLLVGAFLGVMIAVAFVAAFGVTRGVSFAPWCLIDADAA